MNESRNHSQRVAVATKKASESQNLAQQMKRWSDAKLDKELSFAVGFNDPSPEAVAWLDALKQEQESRGGDKGSASQNPRKLTQAQQENVRWGIRWSDGNKLWKVNHVKGDEWGEEAAS